MWHLFFLKSYWKKHKRSLAALLLPGVLLCAVVVFYFLRVRGIFNTYINNAYDNVVGAAEVCICNEAYPESTIKELTEGKDCTYGYAYVTGKTGNSLGEFTCGYLDDPEGLAHVTFEEGRLPEKDNEVAMGRTILNRLGIVSNVGEKVVLGENEYTLCGIIIEGDPKFNKYEQDPVDELYKQYADELPADTLVAEFPKIIFCGNDTEIKYSFTFIDGIYYDGKGKPKVNARLNEEINTKCVSECYTDPASPVSNINRFKTYDKAVYSEAKTDDRILTGDNRWFLFLSIIATVVAALSVLTVLHIIFSYRKSDFEMLHRIGVSKKGIAGIHVLECIILSVVQIVTGTVLGYLSYMLVFCYQKNVLKQLVYSGITDSPYVTYYTRNPMVCGAVISALVMLLAYVLCSVIILIKAREKKKSARNGSLSMSFFHIFKRPQVTMIQIVSLALICLGISLAYIYYTFENKGYVDGVLNATQDMTSYSIGDGLNLKEDKIADYFSTLPQNVTGFSNDGNNELSFAEHGFDRGLGDEDAEKLGDVFCLGKLENTVFVTEERSGSLNYEIGELSDEMKEFILENSSESVSDFFAEGIGSKYLYKAAVRLANRYAVSRLEGYVSAGRIDYDALDEGREIIIVTSSETFTEKFKPREEYTLASILSSEQGYGIEEVSGKTVTVGAVILLPGDSDRILKYAGTVNGLLFENRYLYNVLTTSCGAKNIGIHNAEYTEIISQKNIDGSLIPPAAHMTRKNYKKIKHDNFVQKLIELSGIIGISIIMTVLGFAAYFNAIGMKIRSRAYEISIIRALGTPMRKLKFKFALSSMKIPLISCAAAAFITKRIQMWSKHAYKVFLDMENKLQKLQYEEQIEYRKKVAEYETKHFLGRGIWMVPIVKLFIIIFIILTVLTMFFTFMALRRLKGDVAGKLSDERKRE